MRDNESIVKNAIESIVTPKFDIGSAVNKKIKYENSIDKNFEDKIKRKKTYNLKKIVAIAIASIFSLTITIYVAAANIPSFKNLILFITQNKIDLLEPIEMSAEDKGIKIEVIGVGLFGKMIKLYVSVEDLVGNRIGKDLSFMDYYSLRGGFINTFGWGMLNYDEVTKKATLSMEASSAEKINGDDLTFRISKIFYNRKEFENYNTLIDLTKIKKTQDILEATTIDLYNWSGGTIFDSDSETEIIKFLKPNETNITFPGIEFVKISNIGIIDGNLHVQIWRDNSKKNEGGSADFYIKDKSGESFGYEAHASYQIGKNGKMIKGDYGYEYDEYIFKIDTENISEYELFGNFYTSENIDGNWEIKFKAKDSEEVLEVSPNIKIDILNIENIILNPFGANISATISEEDKNTDFILDSLKIKVIMEDGEKELPNSSAHRGEDGTANFFYYSEEPIKLELVKSVIINGKTIEFDKQGADK